MTRTDPIATAALTGLAATAATAVLTVAGITAGELLTRRRRRQARAVLQADRNSGNVTVLDNRAAQ